jgi:hypothetical protein
VVSTLDPGGRVDNRAGGTFLPKISAGFFHACVVRSDNTVACWGDDTYGRVTPPQG